MQIRVKDGHVVLKDVMVQAHNSQVAVSGDAYLTVGDASMLRPDCGPAIYQGKPPPTDYLRQAIEEARAYDAKTKQERIHQLKAELRRLEGGDV